MLVFHTHMRGEALVILENFAAPSAQRGHDAASRETGKPIRNYLREVNGGCSPRRGSAVTGVCERVPDKYLVSPINILKVLVYRCQK